MRVLKIDDVLQDIGTIINDATSEFNWNGLRLREIFLENCDWESSTWISQEGVAYQRYYNVWNETYSFSQAKVPGVSASGNLLLSVGSGAGARRILLCRAIAIAWLDYPKVNEQEKRIAARLRHDEDPDIDNIGWVRRNFKAGENNEYPQTLATQKLSPCRRETWYPVIIYRYWKSGEYERFECQETVSESGWVQLTDGSFNRGFRSHTGRIRVCLTLHGSVWMEELLYGSLFGSIPSDKKLQQLSDTTVSPSKLLLTENKLVLNSRNYDIYSQFRDGETIENLARIHSVPKSVIWTGICSTVERLPTTLISVSFWNAILYDRTLHSAVMEWVETGHPILGSPLTHMKEDIETGQTLNLDDDDLFGMLKLAKEFARRQRFEKIVARIDGC